MRVSLFSAKQTLALCQSLPVMQPAGALVYGSVPAGATMRGYALANLAGGQHSFVFTANLAAILLDVIPLCAAVLRIIFFGFYEQFLLKSFWLHMHVSISQVCTVACTVLARSSPKQPDAGFALNSVCTC